MIHPAKCTDYDSLYNNLCAEVKLGNITEKPNGDLRVYHYSNNCQYDKKWTKWSLMARGLTLDVKNRTIVATPFPKFFNYGEMTTELPNESFEVFEKLDGSLIMCYYYNGKWNFQTKNSVDAPQAKKAIEFSNNLNLNALIKGDTYLFEIIYPKNKIVVSYDFEGMILLGAYKESGEEYSTEELKRTSELTNCRMSNRYSFDSIEELLEVAKTLNKNYEGFVIRFKSGFRIKIKGREYCIIHKLLESVTPLAIWELMLNKKDLDFLRKEIPEEFQGDFDTIRNILQSKYDYIISRAEEVYESNKHLSNKEIAASDLNKEDKWLYFSRSQNGSGWYNTSKFHQKIFASFKPVANNLEGYEQSYYCLGLKEQT